MLHKPIERAAMHEEPKADNEGEEDGDVDGLVEVEVGEEDAVEGHWEGWTWSELDVKLPMGIEEKRGSDERKMDEYYFPRMNRGVNRCQTFLAV